MARKRKSFKRAIPAFGLALVASLALSAAAAGSASAATQHWYAGGTKLAEGTPTDFAMNGTTSFTLKWTWLGASMEVQCSTQKLGSGKHTIENPAEGVAGTASVGWLSLASCTVSKPSNCQTGESIEMTLKGSATEFEGKPAVKFTPTGSTGLFTLVFAGQSCPIKGLEMRFTGSFTGIANSATSSLEFTKASSAISMAGNAVALEGTSKIETTAGKTLTVAP